MASNQLYAINSKHYSVRPEWVWSKKNKRLNKVASLRIILKCDEANIIQKSMATWLIEIGAMNRSANIYDMGGCWLIIENSTDTTVEVLLSSSGQDVLESLDYYVQWLYQSIIESNKNISVKLEELPLCS